MQLSQPQPDPAGEAAPCAPEAAASCTWASPPREGVGDLPGDLGLVRARVRVRVRVRVKVGVGIGLRLGIGIGRVWST